MVGLCDRIFYIEKKSWRSKMFLVAVSRLAPSSKAVVSPGSVSVRCRLVRSRSGQVALRPSIHHHRVSSPYVEHAAAAVAVVGLVLPRFDQKVYKKVSPSKSPFPVRPSVRSVSSSSMRHRQAYYRKRF